jgi:PAS domain S-box-containing protein
VNASCPNPDASHRESEAAKSVDHLLRVDAERFRFFIAHARDFIIEISREHEILYVSSNLTPALGYAPHEFIGVDIFSRIHPDDLAEAKAQLQHPTAQLTCRLRHKDASWRWVELIGHESIAPDCTSRRVLIARDISAQKQALAERDLVVAELARAEKLIALGALAGGMAHDFNNILTAIIAYTGLAGEQTNAPEICDSLDQIRKAAARAKHIAKHVLDFNSQHKCIRETVKLTTIVREALELLRPTIPPNIEIYTELSDQADAVWGNPTQLHQVVINLCHNAIGALREQHGQIAIAVDSLEVDEAIAAHHSGLQLGSHVRLTVTDNGHGMDAATQHRIFEPFFTKREGGTGLGLAVVQRIVRDHDGSIHVVSHPGLGSTFTIFLPTSSETTAQSV